jgi:hypothetical protein
MDNGNGGIITQFQEGDVGGDDDPGAIVETTVDPAFRYTIQVPEVVFSTTKPELIFCPSPSECTTSTTTLPPKTR